VFQVKTARGPPVTMGSGAGAAGLTWSSMVISVVRVLSVFHFWLKLRPSSFTLYLVSRWPPDLPVSVLLEPDVANS